MKKLIVATGKTGITRKELSPDKIEFDGGIDEKLGFLKNTSMVVEFYTLEGYRPVTEEEKEKYKKPNCVKFWNKTEKTFDSLAEKAIENCNGYWFKDFNYFVPIDFKFKQEITDEIAKTRPKVYVWNDNKYYKDKKILIAVREGAYPFITINKDYSIASFKNCELIED